MNSRGQYSIIAALFVAIILVSTLATTYSIIHYNATLDQPQILTATDEINSDLKQILAFTLGYYGSVLQVTGNVSYARSMAANYFNSGLRNIDNIHPQWGLSVNVNNLDLSTNWFVNDSSSRGLLSMNYGLSGLGMSSVSYSTTCGLSVDIYQSPSSSRLALGIFKDENEPVIDLATQNLRLYRYDFSSSTYNLISSNNEPTVFSNGTYVIEAPLGIDTNSYLVEVRDSRGIMVHASSFSHYVSAFSGNCSSGVIEALQNGTMRLLGQNLNLTAQALPIPPVMAKNIHVNQTINGMNHEVPFQIEDWASEYRIPLGLSSNATVIGNRQMIVYEVNSTITKTTIWWEGSDKANQTSYSYTNIYFKNDDPANGKLTNGKLTLQFNSGFVVNSTVGGTNGTASFMRINTKTPSYGSNLAYTIHHGIVRDVINQEAEWSNGITDCPNVYSQIVLTLPANAAYYTYQLRLIFLNSTKTRTITDLCPLSLSTSIAKPQLQTENGTLSGLPLNVTTAGTDFFFNFTDGKWQHHWSQFINGSSGAGVMFTDSANQNMYVFDKIAGKPTGALKVSNSSKIIEILPITPQAPVSFTYPLDITWHGAVATFNNTLPIYQLNGGVPAGLWMIVEQPPIITVTTTN